jgi:hypothetical protein
MDDAGDGADHRAIRALIARQFESLSWSADRAPQWDEFWADFVPGALLFPAARPVRPVTVPNFVERMKSAAASTMPVFEETLLGVEIKLYGNVGVALAVCEQREKDAPPGRAVEALLLVREDGVWRIAAQGWDKEHDDAPIPQAMLD